MSLFDLEIIDPETRQEFRKWLRRHCGQHESVWVTVYKEHLGTNALSRSDVVDECLCFGWIDSRPEKRIATASCF